MRLHPVSIVLLTTVTLVACVSADTESNSVSSGAQSNRPAAHEPSDMDIERSLRVESVLQAIDSEERGAEVKVSEVIVKAAESTGIAKGAGVAEAAKVAEIIGADKAANVEKVAEAANKRSTNKIKAFLSKMFGIFRLKKGKSVEETTKDVNTVSDGTAHAAGTKATATEKKPIATDRSVDAHTVETNEDAPKLQKEEIHGEPLIKVVSPRAKVEKSDIDAATSVVMGYPALVQPMKTDDLTKDLQNFYYSAPAGLKGAAIREIVRIILPEKAEAQYGRTRMAEDLRGPVETP